MNATPQEQRYAIFRASLGELHVPEVQITTLRYAQHKGTKDDRQRTAERTRKWRAKQEKK